ncbi:MAG TPA: acetylornithine/succinylornithine family transaminase [Tepidisphaeraceae bacterium]|jgi:predicted acetylornithine/succinylornithine family transaminase|nr:acetylornithine/succinylornithine family transaminase [Tepidisphaeraceae bacterium]
MPDTNDILARGKRVLIGNYARLPVVMDRGEGSWLWDTAGTRYLDLFAGFGGCILGHCHPALIDAATQQAHKLWHVGNTFYTEPQIEVAERLNRLAFAGKAFFCHGGADSNEAAVKLARLCGSEKSPHKWKILTLQHSFHGRTLAMIAATGNPAVKAGFAPDTPGFDQVPANDFDALQAAVSDETVGIMLEPIQGEGGINLYADSYIARIRKLCDERGILLIFDEVWSGCGRTGRWFGHQYFHDERGNPITPDIMTLGKAVGGGLPVGIMFAKPDSADRLVPGKHGSTLGGNPICMAVSKTIFDVIEKEDLTTHAARLGEHAISRLKSELGNKVAAVRGRGLMLGIELENPPEKLVEKGLERGVVINLTAKKVIRLAPAINIDAQDWDRGLDTVVALIKSL